VSVVRAHWQLVTGPDTPIVTVEEAKAHVRCAHSDADGWFDLAVMAAVQMVEERCRRGLFTQTWKLVLSGWADVITLPRAVPVQSATVQYYNGANTLTTLSASNYVLQSSEPAVITRASTVTWPTLYDRPDPVQITYVVGYTDVASVPALFKMAALFLVGHWWVNRESVVLGTIATEVEQTFASACEMAGVVHGDLPYVGVG